MRVAFIVDTFPVISETFLIEQVAGLLDRNIDVEVFAFSKGDDTRISARYFTHGIKERVHFLGTPQSRIRRLRVGLGLIVSVLMQHPPALFRALNFVKYGRAAWTLEMLYTIAPFVGEKFDVIHCHFGTVANRFFSIKDVIGLRAPLITTFYGYDASEIFVTKPPFFYDRLKRDCALFFVMSENMKERLVQNGFPPEKLVVNPVGINVDEYPFFERKLVADEVVEIIFVGRFVEKKGADDLIRALAVIRRTSQRRFRCTIVGGGPLEHSLKRLVSTLKLDDCVHFTGYMKNEDIIRMLPRMHMMVQPSKTAANGDME